MSKYPLRSTQFRRNAGVNVLELGLVADNATDNTTKLAAGMINNNELFFPTGVYKGVFSALSNRIWRGEGINRSIWKATSAASFGAAIYYYNTSIPLENFEIHDMTIDADNINRAVALQLYYAKNCKFVRCYFKNSFLVWNTIIGSIVLNSTTFGAETKTSGVVFEDCKWDGFGGNSVSNNTNEQHLWVNAENCSMIRPTFSGNRASTSASVGTFGYCNSILFDQPTIDVDVANDAAASNSAKSFLIQASQNIFIRNPRMTIKAGITRFLTAFSIINSNTVEATDVVFEGYSSAGISGNAALVYDFVEGSFDTHPLEPECYRSKNIKIEFAKADKLYHALSTPNFTGTFISPQNLQVSGNVSNCDYTPVSIGGNNILKINSPIAIVVTGQGSGYTGTVTVRINGVSGLATANVSGGKIYNISISASLSAMTFGSAPTVTIENGTGSGATATVILNTDFPRDILIDRLNVASFKAFGDGTGNDSVAAVMIRGNSTTPIKNAIVKNSIIPRTLSAGSCGAIAYNYVDNDAHLFTEYNRLLTKGSYSHISTLNTTGISTNIRDNAFI